MRLEVLAHGDDLDAIRAQVPQSLRQLLARFAEPDHHAALHFHGNLPVVSPRGGATQQLPRSRVERIRPHALVEALDGFRVVVQDLRPLVEDGRERRLAAEEIRDEDLDRDAGGERPNLPNRGGEVRGTAVGQLVAVNRGHDGVPDPERFHGLGHVPRLLRVERPPGPLGDRAEAAVPRADVAHEHEGGGLVDAPALEEIRAARFLADRIEMLVRHERRNAARQLVVVHAHLQPLRPGRDSIERAGGGAHASSLARAPHRPRPTASLPAALAAPPDPFPRRPLPYGVPRVVDAADPFHLFLLQGRGEADVHRVLDGGACGFADDEPFARVREVPGTLMVRVHAEREERGQVFRAAFDVENPHGLQALAAVGVREELAHGHVKILGIEVGERHERVAPHRRLDVEEEIADLPGERPERFETGRRVVLKAREDEQPRATGLRVGVDERLRDETDGLVVHRSAPDPVERQRFALSGVRRDARGQELVDLAASRCRHGDSPFSLSKTSRKWLTKHSATCGSAGVGFPGFSLERDVTPPSAIPHGMKRENLARSVATFRAAPWVVTQRDRWTPIAASLSLPTQTEARRSGTALRVAATPKSAAVRMSTSSRSRTYRRTSRRPCERSRTGYATSWPGPWNVSLPPRSAIRSWTPRCRRRSSETSSSPRSALRPAVMTSVCSRRKSVSRPPAFTRASASF